MPRNGGFIASHEPLRHHASLNIRQGFTSGSLSFLNPTRAHYTHTFYHKKEPNSTSVDQSATADPKKDSAPDKDEEYAAGYEFKWRSRDNRKGRHALVVHPTDETHADLITPKSTSTLRATAQGVGRMFTQYPYWDISYLVAMLFTMGSVVWCINGFFAFLPLVQPDSEFPTEILYGGGITAFIGATLFEMGSVLLMFEAVNENRAGCFGWALEQVLEGGRTRLRPDKDGCSHHHTNKKNFVGKGDVKSSAPADSSANLKEEKALHSTSGGDRQWQWFPSAHELKTHYLRDIGFLACLAQLFGASVFWISGFTALPGVNNKLSQGLLDGIFWTPQIVGGTGFIVSGSVGQPS
ncbi:hypothetical protein MMC30_001972 [Trapelia coarctata]|nr:hypothetical protein [Trapelia coarctata]